MRRQRNQNSTLFLEPLESRSLLAVTPTVQLARGILTIVGTDLTDNISIDVQQLGGQKGKAPISFLVVEGIAKYRLSRIKSLSIDSRGGDDVINVKASQISQIVIHAGAGNDVINCPSPSAQISTDGGRDIINGLPNFGSPSQSTLNTQAPKPVSSTNSSSLSGTMTALEMQIFTLTNQQRIAAGLAPLQVNFQLVQAAHLQADNMARLNTMDHVLPQTATPTFIDRARVVGYPYVYLGENIAVGYPDAASVVSGWMKSPEHRVNILNPHYKDMGIGVTMSDLGVLYFSQEFGSIA